MIQKFGLFPQLRFAKDQKSMFRSAQKTKQVLFVCTGNYYRSRFAEAFFNYSIDQLKKTKTSLHWQAFSRGLAIRRLSDKQREVPVSKYTVEELNRLGIPLRYVEGQPTQFKESDLKKADYVVALSEREHRPMFQEEFPSVNLGSICFWTVEDLDQSDPTTALGAIREKVAQLVDELQAALLE